MAQPQLRFLEDRWDEQEAAQLDAPELLRYRSNLLGADLRITNFGGGNTSSKLAMTDPLDQTGKDVLWVKGSGGDLGSIKRSGFATLYMEKVLALENAYQGVALEDEIVAMYRSAPSATIRSPLRSTPRCTRFSPFLTSIICTPTGASRSPPLPTAKSKWRSSTRSSATT